MPHNLDTKLNEWRREKTELVACTITDDEFEGVIEWFDNFNISLQTEDGEIVLFKGNLIYIKPI